MATKKIAPKAVGTKKAPKTAAKKQVARKPTPKKKAVAKAPAADKTTALQKIAVLQTQVDELRKEAVTELKEKLSNARRVVRGFENELTSLTGGTAASKR